MPPYFQGLPLNFGSNAPSYQEGCTVPIIRDRKFGGMFCALRDVTAQKKTENLLALAQEDLEKSIQHRTQLLRRSNQKLQEEIWKRKRKEQEFMVINQRFQNMFDHVGDGICSLIPDGMIVEANRSLASMLGYSSPEDLKKAMTNLPSQLFAEKKQWEYIAHKMDKDGIMHRNEIELKTADCGPIWTEFTSLLINTSWDQKLYQVIVTNISDLKKKEHALYHQATMDNLKIPEDAEKLAKKIIARISQPFVLNGAEERLGISIGICFYDRQEITAQEMVHKADSAMYQDKAQGGNTWCFAS